MTTPCSCVRMPARCLDCSKFARLSTGRHGATTPRVRVRCSMAWGQQVCPPSGAGRVQGEPTASASTATAITVLDVPTGSRPGGHERHCGLGSWPKGLEPTELCHCSLRTALGPSFAPSWRQLRTRAARWPGLAVGTASKCLVTSMMCLTRQRDCSMAHKNLQLEYGTESSRRV